MVNHWPICLRNPSDYCALIFKIGLSRSVPCVLFYYFSYEIFHDRLLQRKIRGHELLSQVCDKLNLVEKDYFGLLYEDRGDPRVWIDLEKRISKSMKCKRFRIIKQMQHVKVLSFKSTCSALLSYLARMISHKIHPHSSLKVHFNRFLRQVRKYQHLVLHL